MFQYQKINNQYNFVDTEVSYTLFWDQEIAIVFDKICGTLLKHGPKETIEAWFVTAKKKYQEAGLSEIANDLTLISSKNWDPEELNKILDIAGYIKIFYQKYLESSNIAS